MGGTKFSTKGKQTNSNPSGTNKCRSSLMSDVYCASDLFVTYKLRQEPDKKASFVSRECSVLN